MTSFLPWLQPEWFLSQVLAWIKDHTPFLEERIQPLMEGVVLHGRTVDVRVRASICTWLCVRTLLSSCVCVCTHACVCVHAYVCVCLCVSWVHAFTCVLVCSFSHLHNHSSLLLIGRVHSVSAAGGRQQTETWSSPGVVQWDGDGPHHWWVVIIWTRIENNSRLLSADAWLPWSTDGDK